MNTPIIELNAAALRDHVAAEPSRTRVRSETLIDAVDDTELVHQHFSIMFPLVREFAHIGNQEKLWLMRDVGVAIPSGRRIDHLYDVFKQPRPNTSPWRDLQW